MQQPSNGAPAAAEVRLRLLHSPCLILPDGAAHPLRRNDAAVLALLALMGPTSRSRIASLVWPGARHGGCGTAPLERYTRNLRAYFSGGATKR